MSPHPKKKHKPMLNPNSYAIITPKKPCGIQTDRRLQLGTLEPILEPLEPLLGTLTWNLRTCWNLHLERWNLLDPFLGSLCLEPLLGTLKSSGTFTWNPYLEPQNLAEPCGRSLRPPASVDSVASVLGWRGSERVEQLSDLRPRPAAESQKRKKPKIQTN